MKNTLQLSCLALSLALSAMACKSEKTANGTDTTLVDTVNVDTIAKEASIKDTSVKMHLDTVKLSEN